MPSNDVFLAEILSARKVREVSLALILSPFLWISSIKYRYPGVSTSTIARPLNFNNPNNLRPSTSTLLTDLCRAIISVISDSTIINSIRRTGCCPSLVAPSLASGLDLLDIPPFEGVRE